MKDYTFNYL